MPNDHLNLINEFRKRFPLLDKIDGFFGKDITRECIPWFFGFILAAAENPTPGACCFVFDKNTRTTALVSVLAALIRFKREFPDFVERHVRTEFSPGDRVKVAPKGFVYEYDGLWEDFPGMFKLKVLDKEERLSFKLDDVLRLESTSRILPKGRLNSDLGVFEISPMGHLLGLRSCGNNSLIQNSILVHMQQSEFSRFVDSTTLLPADCAMEFPELLSFLPWGFIESDGNLKPNDIYQVKGEPMVAVTGTPEYLAAACSKVAPATKIVFLDGARRIAGSPQAFDDIIELQRTIVLASPDEIDYIEQIAARGCDIWRMSPDEILVGENSADLRERRSFVGATVKAAHVRLNHKISTADCHDQTLQQAAECLRSVMEAIRNGEEDVSDTDRIVRKLFGVLLDRSECCFGVGDETKSILAEARENFEQSGRWMEREIADGIREAINVLGKAVKDDGCGRNKSETLLDVLSKREGQWLIATRTERTTRRLCKDLGELLVDPQVLSVAEISPDCEYDGIIVSGWPNRWNFSRLRNYAAAPDILILAYPFEKDLVLAHKRHGERRARLNDMRVEERSSILGIESGLIPVPRIDKEEETEKPRLEICHNMSPILDFEEKIRRRTHLRSSGSAGGGESRQARLVQFYGECYALLTEWVELPLLNDFIHGSGTGRKANLRSKMSYDLSTGDFVLFRAGGDKEFVRLIAEYKLGEAKYERIRSTAELWKRVLRSFGDDPEEVLLKLARYGFKRKLSTVARWLGDPDHIAPRDYGDIDIIVEASGDDELVLRKDEMRDAISTIRSAHVSAGNALTELILEELEKGHLEDVGGCPVLRDFVYGQVWIVQVEFVEMELHEYDTGQVNRLLWAQDSEI